MSKFQIGDKVVRIPQERDGNLWEWGDRPMTVSRIGGGYAAEGLIAIDETGTPSICWDENYFDLHIPASQVTPLDPVALGMASQLADILQAEDLAYVCDWMKNERYKQKIEFNPPDVYLTRKNTGRVSEWLRKEVQKELFGGQ